MKSKALKFGAVVVALSLFCGAVAQADTKVVVTANVVVNGNGMYDAAGIPIWGYGTRGRAIYAYSPEGLPVYAFERVYSGCYVPDWGFRPNYRGPQWPRGIHKKGKDFRPERHRPKAHKPAPRPKEQPPAPGDRDHKPGKGGERGDRGGQGGGPRR